MPVQEEIEVKYLMLLSQLMSMIQLEQLPQQKITQSYFSKERIRLYLIPKLKELLPDREIPDALEWCAEQGLQIDMMDTSFFLGRETLIPKVTADMPLWREKLFIMLFRNAGSAAAYFRLPPNRVVELGSQVVL